MCSAGSEHQSREHTNECESQAFAENDADATWRCRCDGEPDSNRHGAGRTRGYHSMP